jgi:hypothetical protein
MRIRAFEGFLGNVYYIRDFDLIMRHSGHNETKNKRSGKVIFHNLKHWTFRVLELSIATIERVGVGHVSHIATSKRTFR